MNTQPWPEGDCLPGSSAITMKLDLNIKPNFIDRAVNFIDPVRGAKRLRARAFLALSGAFTGASSSRRSMSNWNPAARNTDSAIIYDVDRLRSRSQDMLRNSLLATGAVNTATSNVVGLGLKLQSRINAKILNLTEEQANDWQQKTESEWNMWADSQDMDIARTLSFPTYCELTFRKVLEEHPERYDRRSSGFSRFPGIRKVHICGVSVEG